MAGGRRSHGQGTFWGDLIGPNPTDRGKAGTKRSLLVDGEGGPLSIVVAGANVHDAKLLEATLDASGDKRYPARRWVVERTLAWLSKCRAVLVRYDKKAANYLGVLQLACALLWFRRQWRLAILR